MALWRDPFDDLIDGLERAIPSPADRRHDLDDWPPLEEIQIYTQIALRSSEEERARLDTDPRFTRLRAWMKRFGERMKTPEARARLDRWRPAHGWITVDRLRRAGCGDEAEETAPG